MNKVMICGRLTADVELRKTSSDISMANITIAVDRPAKDGKKETDFINCQAWRSTADFIAKYFEKGTPIMIEGQLRNNNYEDKNGVKHHTYIVMIDKTYFVPKVTQTTTSQEQIYPQSEKPVERAENTKIGDLTDFEVISDGDTPF